MFVFSCVDEQHLAAIQRDGLLYSGTRPLWISLAAAEASCDGCLLAINASALPGEVQVGGDGLARIAVDSIPPAALRNFNPYRRPKPVVAAGGYVVRPGATEPELLLIFRRGVWDLPKGKQDETETLEACALREVREEIGVNALRLVQSLGTTVHDYVEKDRYLIKTTYWYLMQTSAQQFEPETREGIEVVAWVPWQEALQRLGYDTLRNHMRQVEPAVFKAVAAWEGGSRP